MKRNLTLAIEDEILGRARVAAARRKRTLTGLVRDFLVSLSGEDRDREKALKFIRKAMRAKPLGVGRIAWTRDDLHVR